MKCIVLLSGGLDSYVSLRLMSEQYDEILPLYFDFEQNTNEKETFFAELQSTSILNKNVEVFKIQDYKQLLDNNWSMTNNLAPMLTDNKKLFIPGRNIVFLLYAAIIGYNNSIEDLVISSIKTDISGDGSDVFLKYFEQALFHGMAVKGKHRNYRIIKPLKNLDKAEVISMGLEYGLNFANTWSCYGNGKFHCGICPSCISRKNAFKQLNKKDPVIYEQ